MQTSLMIAVLGLLTIVAATLVGPRIRVASPLLLVIVGIGVSLIPAVPQVRIEPEWILMGVLPPLLYSAGVSMPSMDFRREFSTIGGLSVVLVVFSSVLLGLFFWWAVPGLDLAWGIALGAIVSPTDAVATSIVKRLGVGSRIVTMLEGESLLNDATALVLLRSAVAGAAASVSLWSVAGTFLFSVAVAALIGFAVGWLNLAVRSRVTDSTVNTILSFTVPFIAALPAEALGASGLVAAVVAGLWTGRQGVTKLTPQHRLAEEQNWKTIELVLESTVFLVMGLEITAIAADSLASHSGVRTLVVAAAGLVLTLLVRAAYVGSLILSSRRRRVRHVRLRPRLDDMQQRLEDPDTRERLGGRGRGPFSLDTFRRRVRRGLADVDYFLQKPFGWREGTVVVAAGMRGAVTVAAAQTLPADAPGRSTLVLIAFLIAVASLLLQGGMLSTVVRWVKPHGESADQKDDERRRLGRELQDAARETAERVRHDIADAQDRADVQDRADTQDRADGQGDADAHDGAPDGFRAEGLQAVIDAQRETLLEARREGRYSADALTEALAVLDADQIRLDRRSFPEQI